MQPNLEHAHLITTRDPASVFRSQEGSGDNFLNVLPVIPIAGVSITGFGTSFEWLATDTSSWTLAHDAFDWIHPSAEHGFVVATLGRGNTVTGRLGDMHNPDSKFMKDTRRYRSRAHTPVQVLVDSNEPHHIAFDLPELLATDYGNTFDPNFTHILAGRRITPVRLTFSNHLTVDYETTRAYMAGTGAQYAVDLIDDLWAALDHLRSFGERAIGADGRVVEPRTI